MTKGAQNINSKDYYFFDNGVQLQCHAGLTNRLYLLLRFSWLRMPLILMTNISRFVPFASRNNGVGTIGAVITYGPWWHPQRCSYRWWQIALLCCWNCWRNVLYQTAKVQTLLLWSLTVIPKLVFTCHWWYVYYFNQDGSTAYVNRADSIIFEMVRSHITPQVKSDAASLPTTQQLSAWNYFW